MAPSRSMNLNASRVSTHSRLLILLDLGEQSAGLVTRSIPESWMNIFNSVSAAPKFFPPQKGLCQVPVRFFQIRRIAEGNRCPKPIDCGVVLPQHEMSDA